MVLIPCCFHDSLKDKSNRKNSLLSKNLKKPLQKEKRVFRLRKPQQKKEMKHRQAKGLRRLNLQLEKKKKLQQANLLTMKVTSRLITLETATYLLLDN